MTSRDQEYIENRLLAPAPELGDAIARLRQNGEASSAEVLSIALANLTDICRTVRYQLFYPERLAG
jgi:hypothetical protein